MYNVGHIVKGIVNDALDLNMDISEKRMQICRICPLYSKKFDGMCNSKLWLNPETGEVSLENLGGMKRGCGCKLSWKTKVVDEVCPAGKW